MYLEKQKQISYKDRRLHPRLKCRVTIELTAEPAGTPVFGSLTDVSLGGCYVETSAILSPGTNLKLGFSMDDGNLSANGVVARIDPGTGIAIQFKEMNREDRAKMFKILEFVQKTTAYYNNRYFENLLKH